MDNMGGNPWTTWVTTHGQHGWQPMDNMGDNPWTTWVATHGGKKVAKQPMELSDSVATHGPHGWQPMDTTGSKAAQKNIKIINTIHQLRF